MASNLKLIHQAIIDSLASINGSGDYEHNLSGSHQRGRGRVDSPPVYPYCTTSYEGFQTSSDAPVGQFRRDHLFIITAWAESGGQSEKDRDDSAQDLLADLTRAVEADRSLGGRVHDLTIDGDAYSAVDPSTGLGAIQAILLLTVWQRRTSGV